MGALDFGGDKLFAQILEQYGLPNIVQEVGYYLAVAENDIRATGDQAKGKRVEYLAERLNRLWEDVDEELGNHSFAKEIEFARTGKAAKK